MGAKGFDLKTNIINEWTPYGLLYEWLAGVDNYGPGTESSLLQLHDQVFPQRAAGHDQGGTAGWSNDSGSHEEARAGRGNKGAESAGLRA
eukprot:14572887-Heterocapsa_arctica.AAC.1